MIELAAEHEEWKLDIGIGVDMGEVIMGAMGSKERMDYTVVGDHVNLAARLCSYAKARQTIISDAVARHLTDADGFALAAMDPIKVKGKTGELKVFSVARSAPAIATAAE
jgi:adenylate cyclase